MAEPDQAEPVTESVSPTTAAAEEAPQATVEEGAVEPAENCEHASDDATSDVQSNVKCRGHDRDDAFRTLASELQSNLLETMTQKLQSDFFGKDDSGVCKNASKHLKQILDMGSLNCSSHMGFYSTSQIVANLLHLVVQLMAFPQPHCVTEQEIQTERNVKARSVQCELARSAALKPVDAQSQTVPDIADADTQTYPDCMEVESQTIILVTSDTEMQTVEKVFSDAHAQAEPATATTGSQFDMETTFDQDVQTDIDNKCNCCNVKEAESAHCHDCLKFMMAPEASHSLWKMVHRKTEEAEVQVGHTTSEVGMQAVAASQDEELQACLPDMCEECGCNEVETYHCEECLEVAMAPQMMGASMSMKRHTAPAFQAKKRSTSLRRSTDGTRDAGSQVSIPVEEAGCQALASMSDIGLQAVPNTREEETEAAIAPQCAACSGDIELPQECAICSESRTSSRKRTIQGKFRAAIDSAKIMARSIENASNYQSEAVEQEDDEQNELEPPKVILCYECNTNEAFVQGGRCSDCVSFPGKPRESSPDRQGSRGVRIGGGFDILQVASDRGRMAAAREAVQETVRSESPSRYVQCDGSSMLQYVHGAPSTYSVPSRFHVGMLPRQGQPAEPSEMRLPPAGKKKPVVDAEALVRASAAALNRDAANKTICGEPYLYRVMAPTNRRTDSLSARPTPRFT